jgi:hypothetical protein
MQAAVPAARPVLPFTRTRIRRAHGLPDDIGDLRGESWYFGHRPVGDDLVDTVLAVAAAVAVRGWNATLHACAWAAPLVTDPETAQRLGLDTEIVPVGSDGDARRRLAMDLGRDAHRAAQAARAGRDLFDEGYDAERTAARLLASLPGTTTETVDRQLALLGTAEGATIRSRVDVALRDFRN